MDQQGLPDHVLRSLPSSRKDRAVGFALALMGNAVLFAALVYVGHQSDMPPAEQTILVELIPPPALVKNVPIIKPQMVEVKPAEMTPPLIMIDPDPETPTWTPPSLVTLALDRGLAQGKDDYVARLYHHLQNYMRTVGYEGQVTVAFDVDKNGRLKLLEINKSSGNRALDSEALALLRRAEPLPPIPDELKVDHFPAVVPIAWFMDRNRRSSLRRSLVRERNGQ